jgi:urea transporter
MPTDATSLESERSATRGLTALPGLVVATLAAYLLGADRALIRDGLFGFNGVLTGITLSVFLQWDWHVAVYIILGAIVSAIAMMGLAKLLVRWDMAPLTPACVLFPVLNWWSMIYALIGAIFSAIVFAAIAVALSPIGMPALTAPFVLMTWVFLLLTAGSRALQRVPVAEARTPELTRAE